MTIFLQKKHFLPQFLGDNAHKSILLRCNQHAIASQKHASYLLKAMLLANRCSHKEVQLSQRKHNTLAHNNIEKSFIFGVFAIQSSVGCEYAKEKEHHCQ